MGHSDQKLAIFRGLLKFKSNVQKIWGVLIFLSIVTTIEVVLGIIKPEFLLKPFLRMRLEPLLGSYRLLIALLTVTVLPMSYPEMMLNILFSMAIPLN